jgi:hypothetical protein
MFTNIKKHLKVKTAFTHTHTHTHRDIYIYIYILSLWVVTIVTYESDKIFYIKNCNAIAIVI